MCGALCGQPFFSAGQGVGAAQTNLTRTESRTHDKKGVLQLAEDSFFTHQRLPLDLLHSASCNWKQNRLTLSLPPRNEEDPSLVSPLDPYEKIRFDVLALLEALVDLLLFLRVAGKAEIIVNIPL